MSAHIADLQSRRGDYGIDAPAWLVVLALFAVGWTVVAVVLGMLGASGFLVAVAAVLAASQFASTGLYLYTTRAGKFAVWVDLLSGLELRGDERLIDLGCGRGAVLLMAAKLLPRGRAVGVDLWKSIDQSGNDPAATEANARREGVADRVELRTADITDLPFEDASFDVVVSSMAIHNITDAGARRKAVTEAARVLRPGGRMVVVDFQHTPAYASTLRELGLTAIEERALGWRVWYGGPWVAARLLTATRP